MIDNNFANTFAEQMCSVQPVPATGWDDLMSVVNAMKFATVEDYSPIYCEFGDESNIDAFNELMVKFNQSQSEMCNISETSGVPDFDPNANIFLWDQDEIVGVLNFYMYTDPKGNHISNVCAVIIDEKYRGNGYSKLLFEKYINVCRDQGCTSIRLGVLSNNESAKQLYKSLGFVEYSRSLSLTI